MPYATIESWTCLFISPNKQSSVTSRCRPCSISWTPRTSHGQSSSRVRPNLAVISLCSQVRSTHPPMPILPCSNKHSNSPILPRFPRMRTGICCCMPLRVSAPRTRKMSSGRCCLIVLSCWTRCYGHVYQVRGSCCLTVDCTWSRPRLSVPHFQL